MKISLDVERDTHNSYPPALDIQENGDDVVITLHAEHREVSVNVDDLFNAVNLLHIRWTKKQARDSNDA